MRYDKNILIANGVVAALLVFSLARLFVWTGSFHWNVACGFLPILFSFGALRQGSGRTIGGIAILLNGLLVLGGLFSLLFSFVSIDKVSMSNNVLGLAFGTALLLAGMLNVRAIWYSFPPKPVSGA